VEDRNAVLKDLLEQRFIPIPKETAGSGPVARVSLQDSGRGHQLQVTLPEMFSKNMPDFDFSQSSAPIDSTSPDLIDVDQSGQIGLDNSASNFVTKRPGPGIQIVPPTRDEVLAMEKSLPALPNSAACRQVFHPSGLDAPQVAIDFVLALEKPCLSHTAPADLSCDQPSGHVLTAQAPLLAHATHSLESTGGWSIPATEIERLLSLSSQLSLAGELTPVQAWSRIRSSPEFLKLDFDSLGRLKGDLLKEVQCYGYVPCRLILADC
jgi:hypothetical protein